VQEPLISRRAVYDANHLPDLRCSSPCVRPSRPPHLCHLATLTPVTPVRYGVPPDPCMVTYLFFLLGPTYFKALHIPSNGNRKSTSTDPLPLYTTTNFTVVSPYSRITMAQQFATLALNGLPPLIQNYDTIVGRVQRISIPGRKKSRNNKDDGYQSDYDYRYTSRPGNIDRHRGQDRDGLRSAPLARQDGYSRPRPSSVESIPGDFPPPGSTYDSRRGGPKSAGHDPYSPKSRRGSKHDYRPQSQLPVYFS